MTGSRGADDRHLANVIGAFALDVDTSVQEAVRRSSGLALVEGQALSAIANLGTDGLSIERLRGLVDLSQSATVRLVDRLVALGLVGRQTAVDDRRVTLVQLTASGRRIVSKMRRGRLGAITDWLSTLSTEQRAALEPLIEILVARDLEPTPSGGRGGRLPVPVVRSHGVRASGRLSGHHGGPRRLAVASGIDTNICITHPLQRRKDCRCDVVH